MNVCRGLLLLLIFFPISSFANEYLDDLVQQKDQLAAIISKNSDYGIYSDRELALELDFLDKVLFRGKVDQAVGELRDKGREFLGFLETNEEVYNQLSVDDWLLAVNVLLDADNLISHKLAWGNLVIKIAICSKIFYWVFDYVDSHKEDIDSDTINKLSVTLKKLRKHYPSNTSMFYIALRYYGVKTNMNVSDYALNVPYYDELEILENLSRSSLGSEPNIAMEKIALFYKNESNVTIGSYLDLFDYPVPWVTSSHTDFFSNAWDLYEYLSIMVKPSDDSDDKNITKAALYDFIMSEYRAEDKYWMPHDIVRKIDKKPDEFLLGHLERLKDGLIIENMRSDRESAKKREKMQGDKLRVSHLL